MCMGCWRSRRTENHRFCYGVKRCSCALKSFHQRIANMSQDSNDHFRHPKTTLQCTATTSTPHWLQRGLARCLDRGYCCCICGRFQKRYRAVATCSNDTNAIERLTRLTGQVPKLTFESSPFACRQALIACAYRVNAKDVYTLRCIVWQSSNLSIRKREQDRHVLKAQELSSNVCQ
jgi:hypothetical protein